MPSSAATSALASAGERRVAGEAGASRVRSRRTDVRPRSPLGAEADRIRFVKEVEVMREQQVLAEDDICVAVHVELHERRLLVTATEQQLRHRGAARLAQQAVRLPHGGRVPRRRGKTARNRELRRQLSAQKCDSKFPRQVSVAAVALVEAEQRRVMYKRVRSASICIRISIRRRSIGAAHRRIRIQIRSFSPSVFTAARNIKAHPEYQSRSFFKFDPA